MFEEIRCCYSKYDEDTGEKARFQFLHTDGSPVDFPEVDEWIYKLNPGLYTYKLTKFSMDPISQAWQKRAIDVIFRMMGRFIKDVRFTKQRNRPTLDCSVEFRSDDPFLTDPGRKNVIAYTTLPLPGRRFPLVFDDAEEWRIFGGKYQDPLKNPNRPNQWYYAESMVFVGAHELGHWIGLRHTPPGFESLMDPIVPMYPIPIVDDITIHRIYEIYGRVNILKHHLARWRARRLSRGDFRT